MDIFILIRVSKIQEVAKFLAFQNQNKYYMSRGVEVATKE